MKLDFRIDWGYQFLYSRRYSHPTYKWDGSLKCNHGKIEKCYQLLYPFHWMGPGFCAEERPLQTPIWKSSTKRNLSGIRVIAECEENAIFELTTLMGTFEFPASTVAKDGYLVIPVGSRYSYCNIIVTRRDFYWFQPPVRANQQLFKATDLGLKHREWHRTATAWLAPQTMVEFEVDVDKESTRLTLVQGLLHIVAMAAHSETMGRENVVHDYFPMSLYIDGEKCLDFTQYFRDHDYVMQILQDIWLRFPVTKGKHRLGIRNNHPLYFVLINRIIFEVKEYRHLHLSLPKWGLVNEPLIGRIFAVYNTSCSIKHPHGIQNLNLECGWNEFDFTIKSPGQNIAFMVNDDDVQNQSAMEVVYNLKNEVPEVMVGYDMTVVPHDDNGFMDYLLDYTWRTQLGNMVVFRSLTYKAPTTWEYALVDPKLLFAWGEFCRKHHIHVEACTSYEDGALAKGAGDYLHGVGVHEYPGPVYAAMPAPPYRSYDMKEAAIKYIDYLKLDIARSRRVSPRASFGDASGGHRYCYLAGADYIRSETMVGHTMHLCSQARPCAEALGQGEWGVHIAIQHGTQPYFENHLGLYFLSLMQPWMMGATMIYEEDSLFCLFKEERQAWDDALTKGKRDMTRDFFRWVKTHPRKGKNQRNIAFVEGRYAAPFHSFNSYSDQDYPVWGLFGNANKTWVHQQPEKCRNILDVLMPGACTDPFKQCFERRRFFFSGTPYGDFDQVPIEAASDYLNNYKLLLNLGWNTMIAEDYDKLKNFVQQGGALFTGIPQFSTHTKRDFLNDLADLALWNDGDLTELCGVKIIQRSVEYSGQWNTAHREIYREIPLSALPSHNFESDKSCYLAEVMFSGEKTKVVVWDAENGHPLIIEHRLGKGKVYLLTAWAYPGHDRLQQLCASFIAKLATESRGKYYVEDSSSEIFWTMWNESGEVNKMMLLNTDWSSRANIKPVKIITPSGSFPLDIFEREAYILTILPFAIVSSRGNLHIEVVEVAQTAATLKIHGNIRDQLHVMYANGKIESMEYNFDSNQCETIIKIAQ